MLTPSRGLRRVCLGLAWGDWRARPLGPGAANAGLQERRHVVPLTVTVVDRKGVPVTDLTQSDFTVFENGRERQVLNFFPQFMGPGIERADAVVPSGGIAPARRRLFLIVLGFGRIQYPGRVSTARSASCASACCRTMPWR